MAKASGHYVVTHSLVNDWPRGTVLSADALQVAETKDREGKVIPAYDMTERLVKIGAIRPASDVEAKLPSVTLTAYGETLSPQAQAALADKEAQIETLRNALAAKSSKMAFYQQQGVAKLPPGNVEPDQALLEEKDAVIEALTQSLEATDKGLAEAQKALTERDEAAQKALAKEAKEAGHATPAPASKPHPAATHPHKGSER